MNTATTEIETTDPLVFTDNAATKVKSLIEEEGNDALKLRIYITGGGCSGFQYGFSFDESVNDGDTVVDKAGVSLLIDPMSFQYLNGAEVDYSEGLEGSHFVIRNPNATTTCGCGFSRPRRWRASASGPGRPGPKCWNGSHRATPKTTRGTWSIATSASPCLTQRAAC